MRDITVFPEEYKLLNEQVEKVTLIHALSPDEHTVETLAEIAKSGYEEDYRACEFWINLKDGRAYGFLASTPEHLRDYMESENLPSFVSLGLLVVREMTEAAIMHALEKCLSEAAYHGVEPLGYRMIDSDDDEDDDLEEGESSPE